MMMMIIVNVAVIIIILKHRHNTRCPNVKMKIQKRKEYLPTITNNATSVSKSLVGAIASSHHAECTDSNLGKLNEWWKWEKKKMVIFQSTQCVTLSHTTKTYRWPHKQCRLSLSPVYLPHRMRTWYSLRNPPRAREPSENSRHYSLFTEIVSHTTTDTLN